MIINLDERCSVFFGDAQKCSITRKFEESPEFSPFFKALKQNLGVDYLVLSRQTHGTEGRFIHNTALLPSDITVYQWEGDYLVTDQPRVGIGVLTADCLPIVAYDSVTRIVAVAHAGWRGSVADIATIMVDKMVQARVINLSDLRFYFGPSAQNCCYEVKDDFIEFFKKSPHKDQVISLRDGKYYCDVPLFNTLRLIDRGIKPSQISREYNVCTICDTRFHSYRRALHEKTAYANQATFVWLR